MTNRERALAVIGTSEGMSYLLTADVLRIEKEIDDAERRGRHSAECDTCHKPTGGHDSVACMACLEKEADAEKTRVADAERRGWIEALEWVTEEAPMWPVFRRKLEELRAQETER